MNGPIEIFFSYAHEDEELMNDVRRQLVVEERNGRIVKWHDRMIPPGSDWKSHIDRRINKATIVLLFVSAHFIESHYCYEVEVPAALDRHKASQAKVIPIILRPCLWERTPFASLQALPLDGRPVSTWLNRDEACLDVARGVMSIVDDMLRRGTADDHSDHSEPAEALLSTSSADVPGRSKIERLMPALLREMRTDLLNHPTTREFVILKRGWIYNHEGNYLAYYLEEHEDLEGKLQILENLALIREVTYTNVRRFVFEEEFVDYLLEPA